MERKSFVFYKEWMDAIKDLPDDIRLEIYESIIEYATTGNVRGLKSMAKIAFNFIKTTIDRDTKKYLGIVERNRSNGNKGGRPKGETHDNPNNPTKPSGFFGNPNNLDNDNDNDNGDNKLSSPSPPKGEGINSKARFLFQHHFRETFGSDYYWTAKDAGAMSQLLKKLKFQREQKKMDVSDDSLLYALQYLLSSVKEGWIFENFSVTNINSKFNELVAQAKKSTSTKSSADIGVVLNDNSPNKYDNDDKKWNR